MGAVYGNSYTVARTISNGPQSLPLLLFFLFYEAGGIPTLRWDGLGVTINPLPLRIRHLGLTGLLPHNRYAVLTGLLPHNRYAVHRLPAQRPYRYYCYYYYY